MNRFQAAPALFFENARIIDPLGAQVAGTLRLANGRIAGTRVSPQRGDIRMDLDGALVLPGLINAHDHLELNNFPRWKFRPCCDNAREWSAEANARLDTDPEIVIARLVPLAERLYISGLKNLLSGATTVAHHNPFHAPLKKIFPVRVVSRYGWSHSLYLAPHFADEYRRTPRNFPYMIHLAEGTDAAANSELQRLDDAGALQGNTVLIHGVGLTPEQRDQAIAKHAALVWCPGSNFFLLNATAQVREFSDAHLLAIGSDSRLTGERDLLEELRIARATNQISPQALVHAVTDDAARILRLQDVGHVSQGMCADLVILPSKVDSAGSALGQISRADLRAVILNGRVRVADLDFAPLLPDMTRVQLDGREKILARDLTAPLPQFSIREPGLSLA